jgi:hypothetical protein
MSFWKCPSLHSIIISDVTMDCEKLIEDSWSDFESAITHPQGRTTEVVKVSFRSKD